MKIYLTFVTFVALGIWISCGSTVKTSKNVHASILLPQNTISSPEGLYLPSEADKPTPNTIVVSQPAPVRPQAKLRTEPLLECRAILDTVAHLNEESYDMITRAKEELSSP